MSRKNRVPLADRVARAADAALAAQHFVSAIDVFLGIGWLDPGATERWRRGQIDCLEEAVQADQPRIAEAMRLFGSWAITRRLVPSPTAYVGRTPDRPALRFSRSENPAIEESYRTHWVSPELSEKKRERLAETASRAPELVAIQPLNTEWVCHRCGGSGGLLVMETSGPGVPALCWPRRSRISAGRRCLAHATRQIEKRPACCRRALQQDSSPLRATRSAGRAAGLGRCTEILRTATVLARPRGSASRSRLFVFIRKSPRLHLHFVHRLSSLTPNSVHSQLKL